MVHKKYTRRGGRVYGPYLYKSERVGGKVLTHYVGKGDAESVGENSRKYGKFFLIATVVFVALLVGIFLFNGVFSPTGRVSLGFEPVYKEGEVLSGILKFNLKEGEFVPFDSKVMVSLGEESREFKLSELLNIPAFDGEYFSEGSELFGKGLGYGSLGERKIYPIVEFELSIYGKDTLSGGSGDKEKKEKEKEKEVIEEPPVEGSVSGIPDAGGKEKETTGKGTGKVVEGSENPDATGITGEVIDEDSIGEEVVDELLEGMAENESGTDSIIEEGVGDEDGGNAGVSGEIVKEEAKKIPEGFIIFGTAKAGEDFSFELEPWQSAELIEGSVKVNGEKIADSLVHLSRSGGEVIVSTSYSTSEEGYGEEYLGDKISDVLEIDFSKFGINATDGFLEIRLHYFGENIVSVGRDIETFLVIDEESNKTVVANGTLIANESVSVNETIIVEENVSLEALALINEIPNVRIVRNGRADLNLNDYFSGAERYEMNIVNVSTIINGSILSLIPQSDFSGAKKGIIKAFKGMEVVESNEFDVLVSSGAISLKTSRAKVVVGEKVRWRKNITIESPEVLSIELSSKAENISVKKLSAGEEIEVEASVVGGITGRVSAEIVLRGNSRFIVWLRQLARDARKGISGRSVDVIEKESDFTEVLIDEDATEYVIEYYTEGPQSIEEFSEEGSKIVTISGDDEFAYGEVIASAELNNSGIAIGKESAIRIYWYNYEFENASINVSREVGDVEEESIVEDTDTEESIIGEEIVQETEGAAMAEGSNASISNFNSSEAPVLDNKTSAAVTSGSLITGRAIDDVVFDNTNTTEGSLSEFELKYGIEGVDYVIESVPFDAYDLDENEEIDYLEWVVPHLSNQSYEIIIEIIKANHLDENRTFIEDIYEEVKALDGIWKEIPNTHYVRVTFEQKLDSSKDITLYARSNYSNSSVEVYEVNGSQKLADFGLIGGEGYYKIFLNNLTEVQDVFDLRVAGGGGSAVEFDWIVDPVIVGDSSYAENLSTNITEESGFAHLNISSQTGVSPPYDSLILYYSFDVNDTNPTSNKTYDYSKRNYDGTFSASSGVLGFSTAKGIYGDAYTFRGLAASAGGWIDAGAMNELDNATQFSIGMWMAQNSTAMVNGIFKCGVDGNNRIVMAAWDNDLFYIGVMDGTFTEGHMTYDELNTWKYWTMVYNGSASPTNANSLKLYQNGVEQTLTYTGTTPSQSKSYANLQIGRHVTSDGNGDCGVRYSNATIDEVMIFNSSLSGQQILDIYNNQSKRFSNKGNISFWNLDSGANTTLNISFPLNQTYLGSEINGSINGEAEFRFANGQANVINFTGAGEFNLTLILYAGNQTTKFYSPVIGGNITLTSFVHARSDAYAENISTNMTEETGFAHLNISSQANNPPYNNLVLYLPFDVNDTNPNTNTTYDYSEYNNDAIIYGATWNKSAGHPYGNAYDFDGVQDIINITDSPSISVANYTVLLWVKPRGTAGLQILFEKYAGVVPIDYNLYFNGNNVLRTYRITECTDGGSASWTNQWHQVGILNNNSGVMFFHNGLPLDPSLYTGTCNEGTTDTTSSLSIGRRYDGNYDYDGEIDELMIFNTNLSNQQILDIYNNQSKRFSNKGNISFWNLDSGANTTLNISFPLNQTYLGAEINGSINGGTEFRFTNGQANVINFTGAGEFNLTLILYAGNQTTKFYSPVIGGNITATSFAYASADSNPPNTTIKSPENASYGLSHLPMNFTVTLADNGSVMYSLSGGTANVTMSGNESALFGTSFNASNSSLITGNYIFSVYANDTAGNKNYSLSRTFSFDANVSNVTFISPSPASGSTTSSSVTLNVTINDSETNRTYAFFNDSLVLWMRMDNRNSSNSFDLSSYSNNGTIFGAGFNQSGKFGGGYSFDGVNDYVSIPFSQSINLTNQISISLWIYPYFNQSSYQLTLIEKGSVPSPYIDYRIRFRNEKIFWELGNGNDNNGAGFFSNSSVLLNNWTHVFVTHNGSQREIYLNGVLDAVNTSFTDNIGGRDLPLEIGRHSGNTFYFNGTIDDVLIFNRTLSASEIQALYNSSQYRLARSFVGLANGTHNYTAHAVDLAGNLNNKSLGWTVDAINPALTFGTLTEANGSVAARRNFHINITFNDSDASSSAEIQVYDFNSSTLSGINSTASASSPFMLNFTGLSDGTYYFNATANDTLGNRNATLTRTVTIDNLAPLITYGALMAGDGANISANAIFVNVTANDTNLNSVNFTLRNGSGVVDNSTAFNGGQRHINFTTLADGNYTFNVSVNDSTGGFNSTSTRTIRLDRVAPGVSLLNPGDSVSYTASSQVVTFQYNVSESGSGAQHCNLTAGGSVVNTSLTGTSLGAGYKVNASAGNVNVFKNSFSSGSTYTWSVSCYDYVPNSNTSSSRSFSVAAPAATTSATTSSSGGGGGGGGAEGIEARPTISVSPDGISAFAITNGVKIETIRITNLKESTIAVDIKPSRTIEDVIVVERRVILAPGESKSIEVKMKAGEKGLITGELILSTFDFTKKISIVINVQTEGFLFDTAVTVPDEYKTIRRGEKLRAQINLLEVGTNQKVDVTMNYVIKDFEGKVFLDEHETFFVLGAKDFVKEFNTNKLPPGKYIIGIETVYPGAFATSSSQFEVEGIVPELNMVVVIAVIIGVVVAGVVAWVIIRSQKGLRQRKHRRLR